eukprot:gene5753-4114_t
MPPPSLMRAKHGVCRTAIVPTWIVLVVLLSWLAPPTAPLSPLIDCGSLRLSPLGLVAAQRPEEQQLESNTALGLSDSPSPDVPLRMMTPQKPETEKNENVEHSAETSSLMKSETSANSSTTVEPSGASFSFESTPPPNTSDDTSSTTARPVAQTTALPSPPPPRSGSSSLPYPDHDADFPDEYIGSPSPRSYLAGMVREDVLRMPILHSLTASVFAGLQLSSYTSSGIQISLEEREALEREEWGDEGGQEAAATSSMSMHKLLASLTDSSYDVPHLPRVHTLTERYFLEQVPPTAFRAEMCHAFVRLMHLRSRSPLVVNLNTFQVAKFALRCLYFKSEALRDVTGRKFVLLASTGDTAAAGSFTVDPAVLPYNEIVNPAYLLKHPLLAHWYSVNGNVQHPKFTSLPVGYRFYHRSGRSLVPSHIIRGKEEERNTMITDALTRNLNISTLFPHILHPLRWGRRGCMWLEKALELFVGETVDPPVEWVRLDELPQRITTIYLVLLPLQLPSSETENTSSMYQGSFLRPPPPPDYLTNRAIISVAKGVSSTTAAASAAHVALLPMTVALYQRMRRIPFGDPRRDIRILDVKSWWENQPRNSFLSFLDHSTISEELVHKSGEEQRVSYSLLNFYTFGTVQQCMGYDSDRIWEIMLLGAVPLVEGPSLFLKDAAASGMGRHLGYVGLEPATEKLCPAAALTSTKIRHQSKRNQKKKVISGTGHQEKTKNKWKGRRRVVVVLVLRVCYFIFSPLPLAFGSVFVVELCGLRVPVRLRFSFAPHSFLLRDVTTEIAYLLPRDRSFIAIFLALVFIYLHPDNADNEAASREVHLRVLHKRGVLDSICPPQTSRTTNSLCCFNYVLIFFLWLWGDTTFLPTVLFVRFFVFFPLPPRAQPLACNYKIMPSGVGALALSMLTSSLRIGVFATPPLVEFRAATTRRRTLPPRPLFRFFHSFGGGEVSRPTEDQEYVVDTRLHSDAAESLILMESNRVDIEHVPFITHLGVQHLIAGIQFSHFSVSSVWMSKEERMALEAQHQNRNRRRINSSDRPHPHKDLLGAVAPHSVLPLLTDNADCGEVLPGSASLRHFMDVSFVQQIYPRCLSSAFCKRFAELMQIPNMSPLIVEVHASLVGRFATWCLYYQTYALQTAQRKFVLVSSEGGMLASTNFQSTEQFSFPIDVNLTYLLNHPLLAHYYAVNGDIRHIKFSPLPAGFLFFHPDGLRLLPRAFRVVVPPILDISDVSMLNYLRHSTNLTLASKPKTVEAYYKQLSENMFVATPHEPGMECSPIWEGLAMGAIPIVFFRPKSDQVMLSIHSVSEEEPSLPDSTGAMPVEYCMLCVYALVASSSGMGFECFRTWESLVMGGGRTPILQYPALHYNFGLQGCAYLQEVNATALRDLYDHLPEVFVHHLSEITETNLKKWCHEIDDNCLFKRSCFYVDVYTIVCVLLEGRY